MPNSQIKRGRFGTKEPSVWKSWGIAALAAAVLLGVAIGLMWQIGLFPIPADDTGEKTLAAALALVGSVIAAAVTLVGTALKFAIDDRNARLAVEAEKRNRIEAAIRAVGLIGENKKSTAQSQTGGALLALVNLGELDLAVALLAELWPQQLVSPEVADVVVAKALATGSETVQVSAASVLAANAKQIGHADYHVWPFGEADWRADLPRPCRIALILAAAEWMKAELAEGLSQLPAAAAVCYEALTDTYGEVVAVASACLRPVAGRLEPDAGMSFKGGVLSVADINERLVSTAPPLMPVEAALLEKEIVELITRPYEPNTVADVSGAPEELHSDD